MTLLSLTNVVAGYGPLTVLKDISFFVNEGEIVTIIGSNGAGKSTTLRCISRLIDLKGGLIEFSGKDLSSLKAHDLVSQGIAHVPEGRRVFPRLTVGENLELGAFNTTDKNETAKQMEYVQDLFPILKERSRQNAGTLSGGEQQMLAIGRALMSRPKLLLLDEPSMGIAPIVVERIFETLVKLNKEGVTLLLVEQNAHLALEISNRGYVIETGSITMSDAASALLTNPQVLEAYLGA